jgi:16S rRNA (guanine527-N7)-methyltransferase
MVADSRSPLAILFGNTFSSDDIIAKKIKVVQAVVDELGLENESRAIKSRISKGDFDFIVSRAVTASLLDKR